MDLGKAVFRGRLSWRRFAVLLRGLSQGSWWTSIREHDAARPQVLSGADVDAYFVSQKAAG